jgi:hypothetical protein
MAQNEDRSFQDNDPNHGKDTPAYKADPGQPVMGDGTEEQNLGQAGDETARISEDEVRDAFNKGDQGQGQPQGER